MAVAKLPAMQVLDEAITYFGGLTPNRSQLAFRELPVNSLTAADRHVMCPTFYEEQASYFKMNESLNVLFVLGGQKCGTTYLPWIEDGKEVETWRTKELHFFDQFPLAKDPSKSFASFFPSDPSALPPGSVLLDGTPNYLYVPMAAPRIQAMVPQAKFVVLLRDPVMREYSAWSMVSQHACERQLQQRPNEECLYVRFWQHVEHSIREEGRRKCLFTDSGRNKTWADCYACSYVRHTEPNLCKMRRADGSRSAACVTHQFGVSISNYAAQLSWWLSFFPPDRFLILRSSDLKHPDPHVRVNILNNIKTFAGAAGPDFDARDMETFAHPGKYDLSHLGLEDLKALLALRLMYRQSLADLTTIVRSRWRFDFGDLEEELTEADLRERIDAETKAGFRP